MSFLHWLCVGCGEQKEKPAQSSSHCLLSIFWRSKKKIRFSENVFFLPFCVCVGVALLLSRENLSGRHKSSSSLMKLMIFPFLGGLRCRNTRAIRALNSIEWTQTRINSAKREKRDQSADFSRILGDFKDIFQTFYCEELSSLCRDSEISCQKLKILSKFSIATRDGGGKLFFFTSKGKVFLRRVSSVV